MSTITVYIVYEGRRKKLDLPRKTFSAIEDAAKEKFRLEDVVLMAKQKDGTECDLWGDADLEKFPTTTEIIVYEHLENPLAIKFGTEEHALNIIPPSTTALMKVARGIVLNDFDVPEFVGRLGEFITCVRWAYNHLVAAGENHLANDLQILGRDTLKPLSEKCKVTLDMYAMTCRDILEKLQAVFEYCRDGLNESALINLDYLGKLAGKMKEESTVRANELEKAMEKASVVLRETEYRQADKGNAESRQYGEWQRETKKMELFEKERKVSESAIENAEKAKQAYKAVDKTIGFWKRFGWSFKYAFGAKSSGDQFDDWIEKWDKKKDTEEMAVGARAKASEARKKEDEKKITVAHLKKGHDKVNRLVECLRKAVEAMRKANVTMQMMSTFWERMEIASGKLAGSEPFVECIKSATKGKRSEATRLLRSRAFKVQGITYMARCVAIRDISTACSSGMYEVGKDMDLFLTDTPSRTDALKWLEDVPFIDKSSPHLDVFRFDKGDGVDPKNEQEARKCFQLASDF